MANYCRAGIKSLRGTISLQLIASNIPWNPTHPDIFLNQIFPHIHLHCVFLRSQDIPSLALSHCDNLGQFKVFILSFIQFSFPYSTISAYFLCTCSTLCICRLFRFQRCVGGCWDRIQDCGKTFALIATPLVLIHKLDLILKLRND